MRRRALLLSLLAPAVQAPAEVPVVGWRLADAATVTADGARLSTPGCRMDGWTPAVVPGTVLTSLVAAGRYPEPLYGLDNLQIPESLCRAAYWYRTEFDVPRSDRRRWLRFDGVNTMAEVWVDGHRVGDVRGAFARGLFDVTAWTKPGARAAVAVKILPPNHPGTPHEQTLAGGTGPNGGATGADGVTFASTVGWDWIPGIRDRDMGLWQGVALLSTGPVTIHDPWIRTTKISPLPSGRVRRGEEQEGVPADHWRSSPGGEGLGMRGPDSAEISVETTLRNASNAPQTGTLEGRVEGTKLAFRLPATIAPGESKIETTLRLDHPRLWWPAGYGKPDLYRLRLRFVQGRSESDAAETTFGVRQMAYFRGDSKKLLIQVNGVPIMCRGGNWGIDEAMKRSPLDRLRAQMRLHRDANLNMVRNWVGQSTQEDFYRAADEYGIMVWDDFWLANPADGPPPVDEDLFLANAREKILRYRNHPSIALWCGRNEGMPPPKIEAGLERMTRELDGTRFYQPHSAALNGVSGGGPYGQVPFTRYFGVGDAFHTEVGAPSIPTLASIEGMMPQRDWWPIDDDWAYHDLTRGAQGGDRYLSTLSRRYGPVAGFRDFARKGAMLTYETYRAMFEGRNARLFAPVSGTLLWMSNPAQPSFVWQLYHHDLDPTAAMFGTKVANEPVHVQLDPDGHLEIINTTPIAFPGAIDKVDIYAEDGQTRRPSGPEKVDVPASGVAHKDWMTGPIQRHRLYDASGKLLSENVYWSVGQPIAMRESLGLYEDLSFLDRLPKVTLEGSAQRTKGGMIVTLRNPAKTVALLTHLSLRDAQGRRVLPAFYSDNFIHLFPGESKTITVEGAGGTQVSLDGWNLAGVRGPGLKYDEDARPEPPLPPPALRTPPLDIDCGGEAGQGAWSMDDEFADGGTAAAQPGEVVGSDLPQGVLRTERWGEFAYTIPVPAGKTYTVRLVFAETSQPRVGGRRFAVDIDSERVLDELDIFREAGGANRALVKEFQERQAEPERKPRDRVPQGERERAGGPRDPDLTVRGAGTQNRKPVVPWESPCVARSPSPSSSSPPPPSGRRSRPTGRRS